MKLDTNHWLAEWHMYNALKLIGRINAELSKDVDKMMYEKR